MVAIHQHRSRRARPGQNVERQQENLSVPKYVPMISVSGQRSRADRDAVVVRIRRAVQMVNGEPQRPLRSIVTANLDVAAAPTVLPSRLVALDNSARAHLSHLIEGILRRCPGITVQLLTASEAYQPLEICDLSRLRFPTPPPF